MARSDFAIVGIFERFNDTTTVVSQTFQVEGQPIGDAYLIVQQFDVEVRSHQIEVNGIDLPGMDFTAMPPNDPNNVWLVWLDRIPPGILQAGSNRITIRRSELVDEGFRVGNVVIHWREAG